jgi:hypothetical protein
MGKAYGFFNCNASKTKIEVELPTVRDLAQTPSDLELSLIEGVDKLSGDPGLMAFAKEAREAGIQYVLTAAQPHAPNSITANELGDILNMLYQSPLYQKGDAFKGDIVFEEAGKYIFKE